MPGRYLFQDEPIPHLWNPPPKNESEQSLSESLEISSVGYKSHRTLRFVHTSTYTTFSDAQTVRHQAADIHAEMKDGVLVLTVHLGTPAAVEAPQIITIN